MLRGAIGSGFGKFGSRTAGVGTPSGVGVAAAPAGELPGTSEDGSSERAGTTIAAMPRRVPAITAKGIVPGVFDFAGI